MLARKTGAGAPRRRVLVVLGLRPAISTNSRPTTLPIGAMAIIGGIHDNKKEIIDFRLAAGESAAEWEKSLADLYRRSARLRSRHAADRRH